MARFYRCLWYDSGVRTPDKPGHPLYVNPRQGAGRVDDPEHEYAVLYVAREPAGCVAEVFGDFAVWTPALLEPPPGLPRAVRVIAEYETGATLCDLDDAKRLVEFSLKPSQVVSHDRGLTQQWARQIYESGAYDGLSWWSRRDARWTSAAIWNVGWVEYTGFTVLADLTEAPVVEAANVLLRQVRR